MKGKYWTGLVACMGKRLQVFDGES